MSKDLQINKDLCRLLLLEMHDGIDYLKKA